MQELIKSYFEESIAVKQKSADLLGVHIERAVDIILTALRNSHKLLICGNGGSAADAQHFAAELTGRYKKERVSLPAIALTTDTSAITAIGNDYGYDEVFKRQVEGLGSKEDVLVAISTSGNSSNCIKAIKSARSKGLKIITLLGKDGGEMKNLGDVNIVVPSNNTPRIQEVHILIIHTMCELMEEKLFD